MAELNNILLIGNNNLFSQDDENEINCDFVKTGRHFSSDEYTNSSVKWPKACWYILIRKYDIVFFPALNLGWILAKSSGLKAKLIYMILEALRKAPSLLSFFRFVIRTLMGKPRIAFLDRHYFSYPVEGISFLFKDFNYFKTHLGSVQQPLPFEVQYLPMWISDRLMEHTDGKLGEFEDRLYDASFIGSTQLYSRSVVMEFFNGYEGNLTNYFSGNKVPYDEYCNLLLDSRFVVSPSGAGWHCFRHYEALAAGSIPIMDYPEGIQTDLKHGVTGLFYHDAGEIPDLIEKYRAGDFPKMLSMPERRDFVKSRHTPISVGQYLVDQVRDMVD